MSEKLEKRIWLPREELRVVERDGNTTIEGLAVPYGQLSEDLGGFRERVAPDAFGDSIRSDGSHDLIGDVEHDRRMILGRSSKGTLAFRSEADGLFATITVPQTTRGKDVVEDVRNGNLDGMSVAWAWDGVKDDWTVDGDETIREIQAAKLRAVTLTSSPAYRQTVDSLVMRSLEEFQQTQSEDWREENDKLRRRLALARMLD